MEMKVEKQVDNKIIRRLFYKSEISWGVSDFSKAIGPMIDLVFVSQFIGIDGVTVLGFMSPLIMFFELIGSAVANGARNKVSAMIGAGKLADANRVFSNSLLMGGGLATIMALLAFIFSSGLAFVLGARDPAVAEMTRQYILGYLIGFPFYTLTRVITPFLQIEGQYKRVNATSISTTVIDIVGDSVAVFVLHGGMFEIGLATSIGYILPFFIGASYYMVKKSASVFKLKFKDFNLKLCTEVIRLGAPMGITKGSNSIAGLIINNMLTSFNMPYLVAAHGVFSQITVFLRAAWYAPADTLMAFAGVFVGEEDKKAVKLVQRIALLHSLVMTTLITVLLYFFCDPIVTVFLNTDEPEALKLASQCIRISCLSLPFHTIVYNFNNYLMGIRRLRFANIYSFLIECGNLVPITLLMLGFIGYQGAWISKIVNMAGLSLIAVIYILIHKGGKTFSDKMLLMPEDFGTTPENEMSVITTSIKKIERLSKIAVAFAMEHGADKQRALTYGLITEELAIFLANIGFKDGEEHNINARLVAKDDDLIIRMRDDCKPLNLKDYYQALLETPEIEDEEISLAIIFKMAKDVKYTATFGANNLIIRV
ncbi:MATE family efflux transporter [uncultured Ruminococcus sp.]|uniref:MATE family efflux transporter n=1 Tax=uncultured Ruminococcus sp. TaxID=165186 RepID=UPI00292D22A9|nr:MATE family efflux transporter [uncultured Ruminococcus sp.]